MNPIDIVRSFLIEFENNCIPSIVFEEDFGYKSNFRDGGKPCYAKRIGLEFIKLNIPFSSLHDNGYGKYDSSEDTELQKNYSEACKQTVHHVFLQRILPFNEQRDTLLKILNKINFSLLFDNPIGEKRFSNEDTKKLNNFFNMLDDFKHVGLDKLNVNEKLTNDIDAYYTRGEVSNPNIAISFIYNGFSFTEEFMKKTFKQAFFQHFTASQESTYDNLCCINNKNGIKCNYYELNNTLPLKEDKNIKKNKI